MNREMYPYNKPIMQPPQPEYKLARAYVPFQIMGRVYEPEEALKKGTLFPELYEPYKYNEHEKGC